MTTSTPELSERDRRTLELADEALDAARELGEYMNREVWCGEGQEAAESTRAALVAHLAAPQPPSSPATEQREGEPALRAAAQQLLDAVTDDGESFFDIECDNLRTALAAPSPAVDAGVERDAKRYRWLRAQHENNKTACAFSVFAPDSDIETEATMYPVGSLPGELDAAIDAALAAMKETR